jgi:hypothetical protein
MRYDFSSKQVVCVDREAEAVGSASNADGNLWLLTEAECGSLPCGPYVQDREVTCSVCSR